MGEDEDEEELVMMVMGVLGREKKRNKANVYVVLVCGYRV